MREYLLSYGYVEEKPGKWIKPVGYHLLTFNESDMRWANYFMDSFGVISCWESKVIDIKYMDAIRTLEAYTKFSIYPSIKADFRITVRE